MPAAASAGRPFFTDDATLTAAQSCQVEIWWQESDAVEEWWALPACNPFGKLEITAGLTEATVGDADDVQSYMVQAKTLLRELHDGGYGLGVAFGLVHPERGSGGSAFAYLPFSLASKSGATVAHLNGGWLWDRALDADRATWAVAVGHSWSERAMTFVELFGDDSDPTGHLGLSLAVIPERLHLDLTYGEVVDSEEDTGFYTVGASVYLPSFRKASNRVAPGGAR